MKKIYYIIGTIILFLVSFYIGTKIYTSNKRDISKDSDYYEKIQEVAIEQEKTGPNTTFIFKTSYKKCSHIKTENKKITNEMINLTKEELQEQFKDWKIERFSTNEVIFVKEIEEYCGEHYVLKNNNGYITVYKIDDGEKEEIYISTEIATVYLPETDQINLNKGIYVYGKEKLIEILQDFE